LKKERGPGRGKTSFSGEKEVFPLSGFFFRGNYESMSVSPEEETRKVMTLTAFNARNGRKTRRSPQISGLLFFLQSPLTSVFLTLY